MGVCKGSGEAGVRVWASGEPLGSSADGGRQHVSHLSGVLSSYALSALCYCSVLLAFISFAASGMPS